MDCVIKAGASVDNLIRPPPLPPSSDAEAAGPAELISSAGWTSAAMWKIFNMEQNSRLNTQNTVKVLLVMVKTKQKTLETKSI